jgi:hypothetical protein
MAHKGNLYPVLFRRDWNLNVVSNNDGWPNRYIVRLFQFGQGFGTFAFPGVYQCGPATESPHGRMLWRSQVYMNAAFSFVVELSSDFGPRGQWYNKTGQLFELHVGVIATWRIDVEKTTEPGFGGSEHGATIFWDPAWWFSEPQLWASTYVPKLWADGPPH